MEGVDPPTVDQLTTVIAHATAPAFMLGAVASFLSIVISRLERVNDIRRTAEAADPPDEALIARLDDRTWILHGSIYFAVLSGLSTAGLLIAAFAAAILGFRHQLGMAILFVIALALLMASLVQLTRDVRVAMLDVAPRPRRPRRPA
jgi:Na+/melibiose symporter-like transporter